MARNLVRKLDPRRDPGLEAGEVLVFQVGEDEPVVVREERPKLGRGVRRAWAVLADAFDATVTVPDACALDGHGVSLEIALRLELFGAARAVETFDDGIADDALALRLAEAASPRIGALSLTVPAEAMVDAPADGPFAGEILRILREVAGARGFHVAGATVTVASPDLARAREKERARRERSADADAAGAAAARQVERIQKVLASPEAEKLREQYPPEVWARIADISLRHMADSMAGDDRALVAEVAAGVDAFIPDPDVMLASGTTKLRALLVAAGRTVLAVEPELGNRAITPLVDGDALGLGTIRSLRVENRGAEDILLLGLRDRVAVLGTPAAPGRSSFSLRGVYGLPAAAGDYGFNACTLAGDLLCASRSGTGLVVWRLGEPDRPPAVLPLPGGVVRGALTGFDGRIYVAADDRILAFPAADLAAGKAGDPACWESAGRRLVAFSLSTVNLYAGTENGDIWRFRLAEPGAGEKVGGFQSLKALRYRPVGRTYQFVAGAGSEGVQTFVVAGRERSRIQSTRWLPRDRDSIRWVEAFGGWVFGVGGRGTLLHVWDAAEPREPHLSIPVSPEILDLWVWPEPQGAV